MSSVSNSVNVPGLPPINFSGLASGIDTNSIISQLAALERQREIPFQNRQMVINQRKSLYDKFAADLGALQTAAKSLKDVTLFSPVSTVTSSNSTALTASYGTPTGETAIPGAYDVAVTQLAQDEVDTQQSSISVAANSDTLNVSFTDLKGVKNASVAVNAGDSLSTIAQKLNAANLGFYAQVVNGKLQLNGPGSISITGGNNGNGYNLATDLNMATTQAHKTANFTVAGTPYSRDTNTVNDALAGVTFTMLQNNVTTTINVGQPGPDQDKVVAAVKSFVNAYNKAYGEIHDAVNEKPVIPPKTTGDLLTGTVFGDPTLNTLMYQLRGALQVGLAGLPSTMNNFAQLGISTGSSTGVKNDSANVGTLVFDETKLRNALTTDPNDAKTLLTQVGSASDGSDSGLGNRFDKLLNPYTLPATGVFAAADQSFTDSVNAEANSIQMIETEVTQNVTMWQKQFTAMEKAISTYKSINLSSLFQTSSGG